jgi:hypothetical protein
MTEQASCNHCGKKAARSNMRADPGGGGAVCKDWFACAQRRDVNRAGFRQKLKAS